MDSLPLPRLQLTWERVKKPKDQFNWFCRYELLMPLTEHDIRRGSRGKKDCLRLKLGGTRAGMGSREPIWENGQIDTPFRDGAHIKWDAEVLKLPMYVVYGDKSQKIDPSPPNGGASRG